MIRTWPSWSWYWPAQSSPESGSILKATPGIGALEEILAPRKLPLESRSRSNNCVAWPGLSGTNVAPRPRTTLKKLVCDCGNNSQLGAQGFCTNKRLPSRRTVQVELFLDKYCPT